MTGIPVPEITWTRFEPQETNPEGINNDGVKFSISNAVSEGEFDLQILTSTLTISNVDKSDELMYQCSGDNSVENLIDAISTSTAPLTVQGILSSVYLSVPTLSVCLPVSLCFLLSLCLTVSLYLYLYLCLCLSPCLSLWFLLFLYLYLCLSLCLSLFVSLSLF